MRFGVIELGAAWVGALGERLDMWAEKQFQGRLSKVLTMRPSAYLARNVRVTPFHFEPVSHYLERYPHLANSGTASGHFFRTCCCSVFFGLGMPTPVNG